MSRYERFARERLQLADVAERGHDLRAATVWPLSPPDESLDTDSMRAVVAALREAHGRGRPAIFMIGGHVVKLGLSRFLIDLMQRGHVACLAMNGACLIHDFELALVGGTSENVARWVKAGQFGLWRESGQLNDAIRAAAAGGEGLGEAVGRMIATGPFPYKHLSLAAAGWRAGVPVTCHVSIGSDIIHGHANCDGAALGAASLTDFLIFARIVERLEGGLYLNVGTAVTGPEVFLKALSMARNVARQSQREIRAFTTAVFDLVPLPEDCCQRAPTMDEPLYYYRPWKTLLVRTVADGSRSLYVKGDHRRTIPTLWAGLCATPAPASTDAEGP